MVATVPLFVVTGSCLSSNEDQPVDKSRLPGNAAEGYPVERALVACIQDNGIDSELLPNGVISSDKNDTLSVEEMRALYGLCEQRLEAQGFVLHEEPSDELTERNYKRMVAFRECLIEQGITIGEFGSLESHTANPRAMGKLLSAAVREDVKAFAEAQANCPSHEGLVSITSFE